MLAALRAWDPVVGLVVGSYQGCSEELHALAREVAEERARTEWRQMGARSEHEALGTDTSAPTSLSAPDTSTAPYGTVMYRAFSSNW